MTEWIHTNNAQSWLAAPLSNSGTILTVQFGQGAKFPNPTGGAKAKITLEDRRLGLVEIVNCTSKSGDQLTIERAQEGTTARSWPINTNVSCRLTAESYNDVQATAASNTANIATLSGRVTTAESDIVALENGLVIGTTVQPYDATLTSIATRGTASNKMIYTTGVDTWAETDITVQARQLLDDGSFTDMRATLGLGSAATRDIDNTEDLTVNPTEVLSRGGVDTAIDNKIAAIPLEVKAWVDLNSPTSILGSYNVSSISNLGTGRYRVNFTTELANNDYAAVGSQTTVNACIGVYSKLTTSVQVGCNTAISSASGGVNTFNSIIIVGT